MSPARARRGKSQPASQPGGTLERELDRIYHDPPEDFVGSRNALAKRLREDGDREVSQQVRELRRPSAAAWLVNRVSLDHPMRVEGLAKKARRLESVQADVIDGTAGGAELRTAATDERTAIAELVELARNEAANLDRAVNERVFAQVGDTLQAASSDADLSDLVRRGRVTKERTAATLGTADAAPSSGRGGRGKQVSSRKEKSRRVESARRELQRLRSELAKADRRARDGEDRVSRAEAELREAKARLADRRRETRELRREVTTAEKQAKKG